MFPFLMEARTYVTVSILNLSCAKVFTGDKSITVIQLQDAISTRKRLL